jgi:flagellar motor switch protein FliM
MSHNELTVAEIESLLFSSATDEENGPQQLSSETFHQSVARRFGTDLAQFIGTGVDVTVESVRHIRFGEFRLASQRPACFQLGTAEPKIASALLELPASTTGLLLDHLLGPTASGGGVARLPATDLEQRLLDRVLGTFWKAFKREWSAVAAFELSLQNMETECGRIGFAGADEEIAVSSFQLTIERQSSELRCCLPADWLRRLVARRIATMQHLDHETPTERTDTMVELSAVLAQLNMSPEELACLKVGDFIPTERDVGEPLDVLIDGAPAFRANLDAVDDRKAIRIVGELPRSRDDPTPPPLGGEGRGGGT